MKGSEDCEGVKRV